jgi:signal transduction histidine kinase
VRVRDNGTGIDPVVVAEGKEGHFGLQGMHERAARIGAKLTIATSATSGTEITVVVPGSIVFRKASKP